MAELLGEVYGPVEKPEAKGVDPFLVQKLARECVLHFGSGFRHGDLGIRHETYEEIIRFVLDKVENVYA